MIQNRGIASTWGTGAKSTVVKGIVAADLLDTVCQPLIHNLVNAVDDVAVPEVVDVLDVVTRIDGCLHGRTGARVQSLLTEIRRVDNPVETLILGTRGNRSAVAG
jgi:hypothetical protein